MIEKLMNIDRRIVFILVALAVIIPSLLSGQFSYHSLSTDTQCLRLY